MYKIGSLYESFANAYWKQERKEIINPLKRIVFEKDIASLVAQLLAKAITPYKTVIRLAKETTDSIPAEAQSYIDTSAIKLGEVLYRIGEFQLRGANMLEESPIPEPIQKDILQHSLYSSKLLQTTAPIKKKAIEAWQEGKKTIVATGIKNEWTDKLLDALSGLNFRRGYNFEKLSIDILNHPPFPADMDEDEKEEVAFQLEDIAFDLQDLALTQYEMGLEFAETENLTDKWRDQIRERLAILDPDKYGSKRNIVSFELKTDLTWLAGKDTAGGNWLTLGFNDSAWVRAMPGTPRQLLPFTAGQPDPIWALPEMKTVYFRKFFFMNGKPVGATLFATADDDFSIYINEVFVARDDTAAEDWGTIKQYDIKEFLKGGENIIAVIAKNTSAPGRAFAGFLEATIDTSYHYTTKRALPPTPVQTQEKEEALAVVTENNTEKTKTVVPVKEEIKKPETSKPVPEKKAEQPREARKTGEEKKTAKAEEIPVAKTRQKPLAPQLKISAKDAALKTSEYQGKVAELDVQIRRESVRIKNLKYKISYNDVKIENLKKEIATLKKRLENKRRAK
jgi:hypothetical protein